MTNGQHVVTRNCLSSVFNHPLTTFGGGGPWKVSISQVLRFEKSRGQSYHTSHLFENHSSWLGSVKSTSNREPPQSLHSRSFNQKAHFTLPTKSQLPATKPTSLPTSRPSRTQPVTRPNPSSLPVSGAKGRQQDVTTPNLFPETPAEEKNRRAEREVTYNERIKKPLLRIWHEINLIKLVNLLDVEQALDEGRNAGRAIFSNWQMIQRQNRIESALAKFMAETIVPIEVRIDSVFNLWEDWHTFLDSVAESKSALVKEALILESRYNSLKSSTGPHATLRTLVQHVMTGALSIDMHLTPDALRSIESTLTERITHSSNVAANRLSIQKALIGMHMLRSTIAISCDEMGIEGHIYRMLNTASVMATCLPEIFRYQLQYRLIYAAIQKIQTGNHSIVTQLKSHRTFLQTYRYGEVIGYRISEMIDIMVKLPFEISDTITLVRDTFCEGLTFLRKVPPTDLEQIQIAEFRPIVEYLEGQRHLSLVLDYTQIIAIENMERYQTQFDVSRNRQLVMKIKTIQEALEADKRVFWQVLYEAMLWRGVAIMYDRPVSIYARSPKIRHMLLQASRHQNQRSYGEEKFSVDSTEERESSLQKRPSRIDYVTSFEGAWLVAQQFQESKVIGMDSLIINDPGRRAGILKPRLEFLILANERQIAIFHLAMILPIEHRRLQSPLVEILQGNRYLKVGVQTKLQQDVLANQFVIELQNCHDLDDSKNGQCTTWDATTDSSHQMLSDLSLRWLGKSLPVLGNLRDVFKSGVDDPVRYFEFLASRALTALRLYQRHCLQQSPNMSQISRSGMDEQQHLLCLPEVIKIDDFWPPSSRLSRFRIKYPQYKNGRSVYLRNLSSALARQAFEQHNHFGIRLLPMRERGRKQLYYIRRLQAFYLFTRFSESVLSIEKILDFSNPAARILEAAKQMAYRFNDYDLHYLRQHIRTEGPKTTHTRRMVTAFAQEHQPSRPS